MSDGWTCRHDRARDGRSQSVDAVLHRLGGKDSDGSQSVLSRWTFEAEQIRRVVERVLQGRVLNACAGETHLAHDGPVVRNDANPDRPADYHRPVRELGECFADRSFDTIVFDPPFDRGQADHQSALGQFTEVPADD